MEGLTSGSDSIVGGALMGDGSVALIVDLEKLYTEYEGVGSQT
jgi:chemotaxis protein histidine kinase CheA